MTGQGTFDTVQSTHGVATADTLGGCRATVMGLGQHGGGVAAIRFLAAQGALVTVTDHAPAPVLAESLAALNGVRLAGLRLGQHVDADFERAEILVVNPAVRPENAYVQRARTAGVRVTSEIELFLERCAAPVIGVTGANGKSTTAAMIAAILEADGRRAWLGGNNERSLLGELSNVLPGDVVVLELSSFQLYWLSATVRLPEIAVVTNCTPNHLDWHPDFAHYLAAKARLVAASPESGLGLEPAVVLGQSLQASWGPMSARRVLAPWEERRVPKLQVPGLHNRENAACAAAVAMAAGASETAVQRGLAKFLGLSHRLETVGEFGGRLFVNDSQATTPESVIAALRAIDRPCWLLCGGADKGSEFAPLAAEIVKRAAGVACYGRVGERILAEIRGPGFASPSTLTTRLADAVAWCFERSAVGDTILLSPGCASTDQYRDYRQRAEDFCQAARRCVGASR